MATHTARGKSLVGAAIVTRVTINSAVNSPKREVGKGMFEFRVIPKLLTMAGSAIWKSSVVNIIFLVTGRARLTEPGQTAPVLMAF